MTLSSEQRDEIKGQFKQGYDWFRQKTGYTIPDPANVDVYTLTPKAWPDGKNATGLSVKREGDKIFTELYLGYDNAQSLIAMRSFVIEGAQAAFDVYRAARDLGISDRPVKFVGHLAYRDVNGRMKCLLPPEEGPIFTTSDFVQKIVYPQANGVMAKMIAYALQEDAEKQANALGREYTPELRERIAEMTNGLLSTPQVALRILKSVQNTDVYKMLAPHLEANDLIDDFYSGREDPSLVASFLRFLSEELYGQQENVQRMFMSFKASRAR